MSTAQLDNTHVSRHLGQTSSYASTYDPSLLVREPRQSNRTHLGLNDNNLPFCGYDVWNAYEVSCLTEKGSPVTGIAKIMYPCDNKYIVESKSLKLYLNSYNMESAGNDKMSAHDFLQEKISIDLSDLLETDVHVEIYDAGNSNYKLKPYFRDNYQTLEDLPKAGCWFFSEYQENPRLLTGNEFISKSDYLITQTYHSTLLKSNCRVTHQPDWGDVYISMKGEKAVKPENLLKYIVSFRDENHFHEEIAETIYTRLWNIFHPKQLAVTCLYARRGGIDINPTRVSHVDLLNRDLIDMIKPFHKTPRQ